MKYTLYNICFVLRTAHRHLAISPSRHLAIASTVAVPLPFFFWLSSLLLEGKQIKFKETETIEVSENGYVTG
jgi:hypothetical protein